MPRVVRSAARPVVHRLRSTWASARRVAAVASQPMEAANRGFVRRGWEGTVKASHGTALPTRRVWDRRAATHQNRPAQRRCASRCLRADDPMESSQLMLGHSEWEGGACCSASPILRCSDVHDTGCCFPLPLRAPRLGLWLYAVHSLVAGPTSRCHLVGLSKVERGTGGARGGPLTRAAPWRRPAWAAVSPRWRPVPPPLCQYK